MYNFWNAKCVSILSRIHTTVEIEGTTHPVNFPQWQETGVPEENPLLSAQRWLFTWRLGLTHIEKIQVVLFTSMYHLPYYWKGKKDRPHPYPSLERNKRNWKLKDRPCSEISIVANSLPISTRWLFTQALPSQIFSVDSWTPPRRSNPSLIWIPSLSVWWNSDFAF